MKKNARSKQQPQDVEGSAWNPDWWETPDRVADGFPSLILPSDNVIVEPCAGSGQIVKYLPVRDRLIAIEPLKERWIAGERNAPHAEWWNCTLQDAELDPVDVFVTNPPFSIALDLLGVMLSRLNMDYVHARCLMLCPGTMLSTQKGRRKFAKLDCHVHTVYGFAGRVGYLRDGVAHNERQIDDLVWDIRPGKRGGVFQLLDCSKNRGFLDG